MRLVTCLALPLLAAAPLASAGQIVPVGQPIAVGPQFASYTLAQSAAVGVSPVDGSFVVVRTLIDPYVPGQPPQGGQLWADRFDASGRLLSSTRVNPATVSYVADPRIAFDAAGRYVVSWDASPAGGGAHAVWVQRFDADGSPVGGETSLTTAGAGWPEQGRVGSSSDGLVAGAWVDTGAATAWLQFFRDGVRQLPADVDVAAGRVGGSPAFVAAMDRDGSAALVGWNTRQGPSSGLSDECTSNPRNSYNWGWDLQAQRFDTSGQPMGAPVTVSVPRVGGVSRTAPYALVPIGGGAFAAAWKQGACGTTLGELWARVVDADGSTRPPFLMVSAASGAAFGGTLASDGRSLVAAWGQADGALLRTFDLTGAPTSDPVPAPVPGALAAGGRGSVVLAWVQSAPLDPDPYGGGGAFQVFAQRYGFADARRVRIDIKPGTYPNTVNVGSNGVVKVAILSEADFDATTVDPLSVTLADATVRLRGNGTPMSETYDVDGDDRIDLVVGVNTDALTLTSADTVATLGGKTLSGLAITGQDTVRVVPR
jgi:hypothetical protein